MRVNRFRDNFLTTDVAFEFGPEVGTGFWRKGTDKHTSRKSNSYAKETCLKMVEKGYVQKSEKDKDSFG